MATTIRDAEEFGPVDDDADRLNRLWNALYLEVKVLTPTERTDLVQDTLTKALDSRTGRVLIESIGESTWVYLKKCLENEHISRIRRRKALKRTGKFVPEDPDQIESDRSPPESTAMREESRRIVNAWVTTHLGTEEANVIIMRHWSDKSFESIGRALGMSRRQASEIYACALERLKELIPQSLNNADPGE